VVRRYPGPPRGSRPASEHVYHVGNEPPSSNTQRPQGTSSPARGPGGNGPRPESLIYAMGDEEGAGGAGPGGKGGEEPVYGIKSATEYKAVGDVRGRTFSERLASVSLSKTAAKPGKQARPPADDYTSIAEKQEGEPGDFYIEASGYHSSVSSTGTGPASKAAREKKGRPVVQDDEATLGDAYVDVEVPSGLREVGTTKKSVLEQKTNKPRRASAYVDVTVPADAEEIPWAREARQASSRFRNKGPLGGAGATTSASMDAYHSTLVVPENGMRRDTGESMLEERDLARTAADTKASRQYEYGEAYVDVTDYSTVSIAGPTAPRANPSPAQLYSVPSKPRLLKGSQPPVADSASGLGDSSDPAKSYSTITRRTKKAAPAAPKPATQDDDAQMCYEEPLDDGSSVGRGSVSGPAAPRAVPPLPVRKSELAVKDKDALKKEKKGGW
jgi:hypothetical protein